MREHDKLIDGKIINEQEARRAQEQLMMSMMQGGSIDPNLLQQSVEAGLSPLPFENKAVHLETHAAFMKSAEFESLPDMIRDQFYKHFELTRAAVESENTPAGEAPKVSLQLRGAVGPTTGAKIIGNSGIRGVTPQEMLEPSLDTVVIDNKDKPNAEDAQFSGVQQYQQQTVDKIISDQLLNEQKVGAARNLRAVKGE